MFKMNDHKNDLYNILLILSRNIFFYKKIGLTDSFETRIYLMFIHFSIIMIIFKKKGKKFDQKLYDIFFNKIEYNLREIGIGDVTVNKKMKEFNKILYDILLKIDDKKNDDKLFQLNKNLILKYFDILNKENISKYTEFEANLLKFFNFCFELPLDNMIENIYKFRY